MPRRDLRLFSLLIGEIFKRFSNKPQTRPKHNPCAYLHRSEDTSLFFTSVSFLAVSGGANRNGKGTFGECWMILNERIIVPKAASIPLHFIPQLDGRGLPNPHTLPLQHPSWRIHPSLHPMMYFKCGHTTKWALKTKRKPQDEVPKWKLSVHFLNLHDTHTHTIELAGWSWVSHGGVFPR